MLPVLPPNVEEFVFASLIRKSNALLSQYSQNRKPCPTSHKPEAHRCQALFVCHEALLYQFHLGAVELLELLAKRNWPGQENRYNSNKKDFKRNIFKILSDIMLLSKNYLK